MEVTLEQYLPDTGGLQHHFQIMVLHLNPFIEMAIKNIVEKGSDITMILCLGGHDRVNCALEDLEIMMQCMSSLYRNSSFCAILPANTFPCSFESGSGSSADRT